MTNTKPNIPSRPADSEMIGKICIGITITIIAVTALGLLLFGPQNVTMTQFAIVVSATSIPVMIAMLIVYLRVRRKMIDA